METSSHPSGDLGHRRGHSTALPRRCPRLDYCPHPFPLQRRTPVERQAPVAAALAVVELPWVPAAAEACDEPLMLLSEEAVGAALVPEGVAVEVAVGAAVGG